MTGCGKTLPGAHQNGKPITCIHHHPNGVCRAEKGIRFVLRQAEGYTDAEDAARQAEGQVEP